MPMLQGYVWSDTANVHTFTAQHLGWNKGMSTLCTEFKVNDMLPLLVTSMLMYPKSMEIKSFLSLNNFRKRHFYSAMVIQDVRECCGSQQRLFYVESSIFCFKKSTFVQCSTMFFIVQANSWKDFVQLASVHFCFKFKIDYQILLTQVWRFCGIAIEGIYVNKTIRLSIFPYGPIPSHKRKDREIANSVCRCMMQMCFIDAKIWLVKHTALKYDLRSARKHIELMSIPHSFKWSVRLLNQLDGISF